MGALILRNLCFGRIWKTDHGKRIGDSHFIGRDPDLSSRREVPARCFVHRAPLPLELHSALAIGRISIGPRDRWQPGASAANQSCPLRDREPGLKRPIGNLSRQGLPRQLAELRPLCSSASVTMASRIPQEVSNASFVVPLLREPAGYRCTPAQRPAGVPGCGRSRSGEEAARPKTPK